MTGQDFDYLCKLVRDRCAIVLESGKEYLVETRLAPIVKRQNLNSISELVHALRRQADPTLPTQIVEAMVTTESSFFRDLLPFESLRTAVIPELAGRRREERRLRIWCAASSTGQEPYSVAMLLRDHFPDLASWNVSILATDISSEVLQRASAGRFNQVEANRGLPIKVLLKHFKQHGTYWQISDEIRSMVEFRELNLAHAWPTLPRMDLVLIRNVMIYFDVETKKSILRKIASLLQPDGYLLLGGAETTFNLDDSYRRIEHLKSGFFQLAANVA